MRIRYLSRMARRTTAPIEHSCRALSSTVRRLLIAHIADPGVDLLAAAKRLQGSAVSLEGIALSTKRADQSLAIFDNKFNPITRGEADAAADLQRNRDLAFAANRARIPVFTCHPYSKE